MKSLQNIHVWYRVGVDPEILTFEQNIKVFNHIFSVSKHFYKFVGGLGEGGGAKASLAPKFQFGGGHGPSLDPPLVSWFSDIPFTHVLRNLHIKETEIY